ncbi:hypothetical protein [Mycolicibacterium sarraceniae]|uniref:Uncharacterized protein n=1 Tax=Mycolicibacterium sarraceniae TaxID=1534348 RepID=A0A7I7SKU1_9MYCO|nr:hypothetical protein [Mycolicibacterium sarraceniae]BBY57333.1 hypothetical protein MSAR_04690 [Mycolicibacterium sarraceniae]
MTVHAVKRGALRRNAPVAILFWPTQELSITFVTFLGANGGLGGSESPHDGRSGVVESGGVPACIRIRCRHAQQA